MTVFRLRPQLPVTAVKSYRLSAPLPTHFGRVTCEQAGCPQYEQGWWSHCDLSTDLGARQYHYIRNESGRRFTEQRSDPEGCPPELAGRGLTWFWFEAGQKCFAAHTERNDREARGLVRDGDHRGNPTGFTREHASLADWQEDFEEHQDRLATAIQGG
jgi:hypothetical protein